MNRKLNIMIAAAVTVMTLSACSNPATTTTTAQTSAATTNAATQAVTTPAATPAVTIPATTTPSTTAAATMPPATTTAGQPVTHTSDLANVYIKSAEAMAKLDSFRITTESQMDLMGMKIDTKSVMDMFPKIKKSKISSSFGDQTTEMFLTDKKMYMKGPDNSWMYFTADDNSEMDLGNLDQIKAITDQEYMDMFNYEKVADGYKIKTNRPLSLDVFEKLNNLSGSTGAPNPLETPVDPSDMTYEMEMLMNKDYYMTETTMTMTTMIEGKANVTTMKTMYSDFNKVPAFTLPPEALNAKEFTIPQMPSTKP